MSSPRRPSTRNLAWLAAALLLGGMTGTTEAEAAKRKSKAKPAAAAEDTRPAPTMEERQAVFGEVDAAFKDGRKTQVADLLLGITQNPEHAVFHAEAFARLGGMLEELDLPYAALIAYEKALAGDAEGVSSVAKKAIKLADEVGDTALLESVFSANVGLDVDDATRSRMAYLAAREAHHKGNYGTAMAILKMVQQDDPFYAEAKALEGVLASLQGRYDGALAPLLVAQAVGKDQQKGDKFNSIINLNIARAYFAAENFPRAIEYYQNVDRGSAYWPEAQFERAWAHFRLTDMNGAIGVLHTHNSPFFDTWYFPEAHLLRIYSLFLVCKFPEAGKEIEAFEAHYSAVKQDLASLGAQEPTWHFEQMRAHLDDDKKTKTELPLMVTRVFEQDDRFNDSLTAVRMAEEEIKRLQNISANPFAAASADWMRERHSSLIEAEGERIRDRIQGREAELQQMLTDAEISKLDIMQMETQLYQMASLKGEASLESRRTVDRKLRVKKGWRYWPWEGEYWADELGYYRITAKPDCPAGMASGNQ